MEIPNNKKRKFTCFVCGIIYEDREEFKKHIIEKHNEGTDYVLCPIKTCNTPCRDLKIHFKVNHPNIEMPKNYQSRATIWRHIDPITNKIKKEKPKFKQGQYFSEKNKKSFTYRSGYELKVFEYLDEWKEILSWEAEPFGIPYVHEGEEKKYIPDIIVNYVNGKKEVWEIKPAKQTLYKKNKDKWIYANKICESRGWHFTVITEVGMDKLKKIIIEQRRNEKNG